VRDFCHGTVAWACRSYLFVEDLPIITIASGLILGVGVVNIVNLLLSALEVLVTAFSNGIVGWWWGASQQMLYPTSALPDRAAEYSQHYLTELLYICPHQPPASASSSRPH
jgi:hypothetical protein